jgi:hypothetical protein
VPVARDDGGEVLATVLTGMSSNSLEPGMTCLDCTSTHQHGRFCNRCGSKRPMSAATRAVRRLPVRSRTERQEEDTVRGMYDFALARAGFPAERSLDRYLSVLLRNSRSA